MLYKVKMLIEKLTPKLRYRISVVLFCISTLAWVIPFVLPFLGFSWKSIAGMGGGLIVAGEVFFVLSIAFAGKAIINKVKPFFGFKPKPEKE
jgi:hypothetical protein